MYLIIKVDRIKCRNSMNNIGQRNVKAQVFGLDL